MEEILAQYVTGNAADLPAEDESLNFIFSSHVFEHLSNPLGHLEIWKRKLKSGGKIICVVPELTGARDYFQIPSILDDMIEERNRGVWTPEISHYSRYYRLPENHKNVLSSYRSNKSIHVHFYTVENVTSMLLFAVNNLGFSGYELNWQRNHKDFYFTLYS